MMLSKACNSGVLALFFLAILFPFSATITREVQLSVGPFTQMSLQAFVALSLLMAVRVATGLGSSESLSVPKGRALSVLSLRTLTQVIAIALLLYAVSNAPLAHVAVIASFPYPVVWGSLIHRERMTIQEGFLLALSCAGVLAIVALPALHSNTTIGLGELAAFAGHLLLALSKILSRSLIEHSSRPLAHAWSLFGITLLALPLSLSLEHVSAEPVYHVLPLTILGGTLWLANTYLILVGFASVRATTASGILSTETVWAAILGYILYAEVPSFSTYLGASLILTAAFFMATKPAQMYRRLMRAADTRLRRARVETIETSLANCSTCPTL